MLAALLQVLCDCAAQLRLDLCMHQAFSNVKLICPCAAYTACGNAPVVSHTQLLSVAGIGAHS